MFGRICSRFSSFPGKYLEHVQELARNYSGIKVYSWRKQAASQFTNSQNNSHSHHTCFFLELSWTFRLFDFWCDLYSERSITDVPCLLQNDWQTETSRDRILVTNTQIQAVSFFQSSQDLLSLASSLPWSQIKSIEIMVFSNQSQRAHWCFKAAVRSLNSVPAGRR